MIDAGGITIGGVIVGIGYAAFIGLPLLAGYVADEVRIFFGVGGQWAAERRSHDHAADNDDPCSVHKRIETETTAPASGKFSGFAGGGDA